MRTIIIILMVLIPAMLHPAEFNPVISWKAGIAIDMTGVPADKTPKMGMLPKRWDKI